MFVRDLMLEAAQDLAREHLTADGHIKPDRMPAILDGLLAEIKQATDPACGGGTARTPLPTYLPSPHALSEGETE